MMQGRFSEAKIAFIEAECFLLAATYIDQKDSERANIDIWQLVGVGTAAVVKHAFATEMYLKCLLLITNTHDGKPSHNLGKLFDKLSTEIKQKLNARYKNHYQKNDTDVFDATVYSLKDLLHKTGNFFKEARYSFERDRAKPHARYHLTLRIKAIRDIVLECSTDSKDVAYASGI